VKRRGEKRLYIRIQGSGEREWYLLLGSWHYWSSLSHGLSSCLWPYWLYYSCLIHELTKKIRLVTSIANSWIYSFKAWCGRLTWNLADIGLESDRVDKKIGQKSQPGGSIRVNTTETRLFVYKLNYIVFSFSFLLLIYRKTESQFTENLISVSLQSS
jgi:hypothetical protein